MLSGNSDVKSGLCCVFNMVSKKTSSGIVGILYFFLEIASIFCSIANSFCSSIAKKVFRIS
jgi:hypothetical protein